jgi:hypothetical protein
MELALMACLVAIVWLCFPKPPSRGPWVLP